MWLAAGLFLTGLGLVGAVVPLLPTTIFLILAAGCFARSSPRLEAWILNHPRFGGFVRDWRARGAIPLRGKLFATGGMAGGYAVFFLTARPDWPLALGVASAMAAIAGWIWTRPV
ncbi:YbaN family protein [Sandaracinobacter sp. RS1-74]|uniref:YbaN family protein n=1 Tax=Sandaracinobacteroides sayramensis TaxID=2913411 RepID=UPI001EDA1705|nr:YbaN family protein [Sandaracinobacteroides sayramensis]MCG2841947.1 YbaN family protein [Sandaracinobacteroides sayramensis]